MSNDRRGSHQSSKGESGVEDMREGADVPSEIVAAVLAANRLFVAVATSALAGVAPEVTLPQFRTLVLLDQHGSVTVAALAQALGVAPSTATRMCDRLVTKKLIRREVDRRDRRRVRLTLAAQGHDLIEASTARRRVEITRILDVLPPTDQRTVAEALRLLVTAAESQAAS